MKALNERNLVIQAISKYPSEYGDGVHPADKRGRSVGAELKALDPATATADQVNEIIGNKYWAGPTMCDECGTQSYDIVQLGEPPDYESRTACICRNCLVNALALLSK